MRKLIVSSFALSAILALSSCGGGSSSNDASNPTGTTTGTGYYVDSAIEGVSYTCGVQTGTTDKEGKFTFEAGKECTFSVAGVPLRSTKADELVDGKKIVEDNTEIARFLQSIDFNNDLTDGIQISAEILDVLKTALAEHGNKIPTADGDVEAVVTQIQTKVTTFKGQYKSIEQAQEHLIETQTAMTKELLAGKTFYMTDLEDSSIRTLVFNADATSITLKTISGVSHDGDGTTSCKVDGEKLILTDEDDKYSLLVAQSNTYLEFDNYDADGTLKESGMKFYFNEADAKAQIKTIDNTTLANVVVGKTLYDNDATAEFKADGTLVWSEDGKSDTSPYRIDGMLLYTTDEDGSQESHKLISYSDMHITFLNESGDTSTFYFTAEDAMKNYDEDEDNGGGSSVPSISGIDPMQLAGKTIYMIHGDDATVIEANTFNADMTSMTWENVYGEGDENQPLGATGTKAITVSDNQVAGDDFSFYISEFTNSYVMLSDSEGNVGKANLNFEEAKALFDAQNGGSSTMEPHAGLSINSLAGYSINGNDGMIEFCSDGSTYSYTHSYGTSTGTFATNSTKIEFYDAMGGAYFIETDDGYLKENVNYNILGIGNFNVASIANSNC